MKTESKENRLIGIFFCALFIVVFLISLFYEIGKDSFLMHPESLISF